MTVTAVAPASLPAAPRAVPAARWKNRADHYWNLITSHTGRRKLRNAGDYFKALLADQPEELIEEALRAVEDIVGVNTERK
jgi:hypothetical protein